MADKTSGNDAESGSDPAPSNHPAARDTSTDSAAVTGEDAPHAATTSKGSTASGATEQPRATPARSRSRALRSGIASAVWLVAVAAALILSVGALLISLDANTDNAMVSWVLDAANRIDWRFWKIFEMNDRTQNHLVNWGLAAVAYLIVGRIADSIIRP